MMLWLLACAPRPEPAVWEALDAQALEERLATPTATTAGLREEVPRLVRLVRAAAELQEAPDGFLQEVLGTTDLEAPPVQDVYAGTSVYVQVACPGPAEGPDPDFAHGYAQIASPLILDATFRPVVGPVLLQFRGCELDTIQVDGEARARWIPEQERLLASGGFGLRFGDDLISIEADLDITAGRLAMRVPMADGFATIRLSETAAEVHFADAVIGCTLAPVTCDAD